MPDLDSVLAQPPATRIEDVLARLSAVGDAFDSRDGISCFTRLYARVTTAVMEARASGAFSTPQFLEALDINFANLYFGAIRAWRAGGTGEARAWAPLFDRHDRTDVHPLQFALAGMNAHINRDLPVALVQTFTASGTPMRRPGPEHEDYQRVDDILAQVEKDVKSEYLDPPGIALDRAFAGVDDVIANWGVREARDAAWVNGEALWALRGMGALRDDYLASLDGIVGFAGRGLLVATAV
jgi:hypothetical protein